MKESLYEVCLQHGDASVTTHTLGSWCSLCRDIRSVCAAEHQRRDYDFSFRQRHSLHLM